MDGKKDQLENKVGLWARSWGQIRQLGKALTGFVFRKNVAPVPTVTPSQPQSQVSAEKASEGAEKVAEKQTPDPSVLSSRLGGSRGTVAQPVKPYTSLSDSVRTQNNGPKPINPAKHMNYKPFTNITNKNKKTMSYKENDASNPEGTGTPNAGATSATSTVDTVVPNAETPLVAMDATTREKELEALMRKNNNWPDSEGDRKQQDVLAKNANDKDVAIVPANYVDMPVPLPSREMTLSEREPLTKGDERALAKNKKNLKIGEQGEGYKEGTNGRVDAAVENSSFDDLKTFNINDYSAEYLKEYDVKDSVMKSIVDAVLSDSDSILKESEVKYLYKDYNDLGNPLNKLLDSNRPEKLIADVEKQKQAIIKKQEELKEALLVIRSKDGEFYKDFSDVGVAVSLKPDFYVTRETNARLQDFLMVLNKRTEKAKQLYKAAFNLQDNNLTPRHMAGVLRIAADLAKTTQDANGKKVYTELYKSCQGPIDNVLNEMEKTYNMEEVITKDLQGKIKNYKESIGNVVDFVAKGMERHFIETKGDPFRHTLDRGKRRTDDNELEHLNMRASLKEKYEQLKNKFNVKLDSRDTAKEIDNKDKEHRKRIEKYENDLSGSDKRTVIDKAKGVGNVAIGKAYGAFASAKDNVSETYYSIKDELGTRKDRAIRNVTIAKSVITYVGGLTLDEAANLFKKAKNKLSELTTRFKRFVNERLTERLDKKIKKVEPELAKTYRMVAEEAMKGKSGKKWEGYRLKVLKVCDQIDEQIKKNEKNLEGKSQLEYNKLNTENAYKFIYNKEIFSDGQGYNSHVAKILNSVNEKIAKDYKNTIEWKTELEKKESKNIGYNDELEAIAIEEEKRLKEKEKSAKDRLKKVQNDAVTAILKEKQKGEARKLSAREREEARRKDRGSKTREK
ncbi:hypothetical protein FACS1894152_0930 [Bacilli bacterium]|nr:hypothetical protein FACS1894152_0930 [Bacilli bacterium]